MTAALQACPHCAEQVPVDRFCEACGEQLDRTAASTTTGSGAGGSSTSTATPETTGERTCPGCATPCSGEYCDQCGLRQPAATDRVTIDLDALAGVSDRGLVHRTNEDAIALGRHRDGTLAAVVCDGVSSTPHSERASSAAADAALQVLLGDGPDPDDDRATDAQRRVLAAVQAAARAVDALCHGMDPGDDLDGPSCTLVAALVEPDGSRVTVGWVGDSRAYWLGATGGRALTADHSWAVEAVAAGLVTEQEAAADRRAHAITRWLGPGERPDPGLATLTPDGPGTVLVCSDGLWNYLPDAGRLAEVAGETRPPLPAAERLTAYAIEAGGRDNISVVLVPVPTADTTTGRGRNTG